MVKQWPQWSYSIIHLNIFLIHSTFEMWWFFVCVRYYIEFLSSYQFYIIKMEDTTDIQKWHCLASDKCRGKSYASKRSHWSRVNHGLNTEKAFQACTTDSNCNICATQKSKLFPLDQNMFPLDQNMFPLDQFVFPLDHFLVEREHAKKWYICGVN